MLILSFDGHLNEVVPVFNSGFQTDVLILLLFLVNEPAINLARSYVINQKKSSLEDPSRTTISTGYQDKKGLVCRE